MPQTAANPQGAGTRSEALPVAVAQAPATQVPAAQAPAAQPAGSQVPAGTGPVAVKKESFSTFTWSLTFLLILILFCYYFFSVRRREHTRHVDSKAGDEGED